MTPPPKAPQGALPQLLKTPLSFHWNGRGVFSLLNREISQNDAKRPAGHPAGLSV